ncbi:MAG: hypothetical protein ACFFBV_07805 [Promethearchaeota archaeon]
MAPNEGIIPKSKKSSGKWLMIACEIWGIVLTAAVHYVILIGNSPGYPFDAFLLNFLWMDILVGLAVGFVLWIIVGITIAFFMPSTEETASKE